MREKRENDMTEHTEKTSIHQGSAVLAWGFVTASMMWAVSYVIHLPFINAPHLVLLILLVSCLFAGGFGYGRWVGGGLLKAAMVGLICALPNLLIIGSVIGNYKQTEPDRIYMWAGAWVLGSLAVSMICTALGSLVGKRRDGLADGLGNWTFLLAVATAFVTGLLVVAGGMVTGHDAGLAVPDWPNSFQQNMFFYPLSKMLGGVFYEHSHRLIGTLVGLMTIVLTVTIFITDKRGWLKALMIIAVLSVIAQGVMGGLRVTEAEMPAEGIEVSTMADETMISAVLRVVHGVFGQVFLGLVSAVAVFVSSTWMGRIRSVATPVAGTDRTMGLVLIVVMVVQLILGAMVRHGFNHVLLVHISVAMIVFAIACISGVRAWGIHGKQQPLLSRFGLTLIFTVIAQVVFGLAALIAISLESVSLPANAVITTLHQGTGAVLLVIATALTLWNYRLLQFEDKNCHAQSFDSQAQAA